MKPKERIERLFVIATRAAMPGVRRLVEVTDLRCLFNENERLRGELARAESNTAEAMKIATDHAERQAAAETVLRRDGYYRCDARACNCGSWHHEPNGHD